MFSSSPTAYFSISSLTATIRSYSCARTLKTNTLPCLPSFIFLLTAMIFSFSLKYFSAWVSMHCSSVPLLTSSSSKTRHERDVSSPGLWAKLCSQRRPECKWHVCKSNIEKWSCVGCRDSLLGRVASMLRVARSKAKSKLESRGAVSERR